MNLLELKNKFLKNKAIKKAFEGQDLAFEISLKITEARIKAGLTQSELAKKINTKQPGIARVESGNKLPSLSLIIKIEEALNTKIININQTEHKIPSFSVDLSNKYLSDTFFSKSPLLNSTNKQPFITPAISSYSIHNLA